MDCVFCEVGTYSLNTWYIDLGYKVSTLWSKAVRDELVVIHTSEEHPPPPPYVWNTVVHYRIHESNMISLRSLLG
jgi:hypothetical protein